MIRLPDPCLVVLVGPSGSGKSAWADEWLVRLADVAQPGALERFGEVIDAFRR